VTRFFSLCLLLGTLGCAGTSSRGPENAGPSSESAASPSSVQVVPAHSVLATAHGAVPARASTCRSGGKLPTRAQCVEPRENLAVALMMESEGRDDALRAIEHCDAYPAGLIRALRADLGVPECADALVEDVVGDEAESEIAEDIRQTLVALGLAARLRRLAQDPPKAPTELVREKLEQYFQKDLFPWIGAQAEAIFAMATQGTKLTGYARGIVAIEAGNADMRFVEIARAAPLAHEIAEHQEAKDLYYATLDERLEPRKARGRNAALVGLREMAHLGVRASERVREARSLLSKVYGGRRINALDVLMVPDVEAQNADSPEAAIASRVPAPYAPSLVGPTKPTPLMVRAYMQTGMPAFVRTEVESTSGSDTLEVRILLARALFESGRTYFRAEDFQATDKLLSSVLASSDASTDLLTRDQLEEVASLRALAIALSAGPQDATELIAKGPRFADALGNLSALDNIASEKTERAGRAGFNATYLRELVAPEGAPDYWADLGKRYLASGKKLKGNERKVAEERGRACLEIEKALRRK
jgi:hypothetical protein